MTVGEAALRRAARHVGVKEDPPNSNSGPLIRKWLKRAGITTPAPWCMAFLYSMLCEVGVELDYPNKASVGFFEEWARKNGRIVDVPQRGDLVCYRFDADNWPDHVGIVEKVGGSYIYTIEGNTSLGDDANGGMVMRRRRLISRCSFVRIPGEIKVPPKKTRKRLPDPAPAAPTPQPDVARVDIEVGNVKLENQSLENPVVRGRVSRLVRRFGSAIIRRRQA